MVLTSKAILPIVIGLSLCSVSAVILYILLKNDDEDTQSPSDEIQIPKISKKEKIIPKEMVAAVIGRGGSKVKEIEEKSGAKVHMSEMIGTDTDRICNIRGSQAAIEKAESLLDEIIQQQKSIITTTISVEHYMIGRIIGRGGETVNGISHASGAKIKINDTTDLQSEKRTIVVKGNALQIKIATEMIAKIVAENVSLRQKDSKKREPRGKYASTSNTETDKISDNGQDKGSHAQNAPPAGTSGALLEVFVSAVSSPSRFWLQIVGPQVEELDKLVDFMTEYYGNSENRELHKLSDIRVGQIVAAVFRHDGKWYRAKVAEIKPNEFDGRQEVCDVYFVDYGDNEYIAKDELLSLRTDMLKLRFQAVECFLAGVTPAPTSPANNNQLNHKWSNPAIERFEELTQVAQWKKLWSRTCAFKERPKPEITEVTDEAKLARSSREGSPIPGVKLYDTKEGKDVNIAQVLIDEEWAVEIDDQETASAPPVTIAPFSTPTTPTAPPPSFGDLECSRVLGMVIGNRDERAASLPHGGSSPSNSPKPSSPHLGHSPINLPLADNKPKSLSLAAGMDHSPTNKSPIASPTNLSYPKSDNGVHHLNGSANNHVNKNNHHNGDFLNAERGNVETTNGIASQDAATKPHPFHIPDPRDDLKAKMNRVDSHHGSLETMAKQGAHHTVATPHGDHSPNRVHQ